MNVLWIVAIVLWVLALATLLMGERLNTVNAKIDDAGGFGVRSRRMNPKFIAATLVVLGVVSAVLAVRG